VAFGKAGEGIVSTTVPDPASTDWVPLFDLGRQPVKYLGSYSASTTYNDGDVVIGPDGIAYICVVDGTLNVTPSWTGQNPPAIPLPVVNGQWIKGVGGAAVWSPITPADVANIPYTTTLPGSPYDGQEVILVNSLTAPTWQWRLRYNAGSSNANKWEFVGGTPLKAVGSINVPLTPANAWVTAVATVAVPVPGVYWCQGNFRVSVQAIGNNHTVNCTVQNAGASGGTVQPGTTVTTAGGLANLFVQDQVSIAAGGSIYFSLISSNISPTADYADQYSWSAIPIRVG